VDHSSNGNGGVAASLVEPRPGPEPARPGRRPEPDELVIEPTPGWRPVDLAELARHGDMLWFMIRRDIRGRYAQSALGVGWAVIQPLATALIFTVVFGRVAGIKFGNSAYPLAVFCGLVPWTYFANALNSAATSLTLNARMLSKIYFPRLVLPLTAVLGKLLDLAIALVVLAGFLAWYRVMPGPWALVLAPALLALLVLAVLGLGLWLSALAVQYRDVAYGLTFAIQLLMYLSPVVYPAEKVPAAYRLLYGLNPMAGIIEGFRAALIGSGPIPWDLIVPGAAVTLALVVSGLFYFRRAERLFADVA
jgi:lipopolysaccharide transport system permease protein